MRPRACPGPGRANLGGHRGDGLLGPGGQQVGGSQKDRAALVGAYLGPGGERSSRGVDRRDDVRGCGRGDM